jgi:hypothetical protein
MIAHLHDPDRPLLSLCGTPLLGIESPPGTERCVVCLDLDDFREEDGGLRPLRNRTSLSVGGGRVRI